MYEMILPLLSGLSPYLKNGRSRVSVKRHKPEKTVSKVQRVEVLVGQGMEKTDAIRQVHIIEQTFRRLRKAVSDLIMDIPTQNGPNYWRQVRAIPGVDQFRGDLCGDALDPQVPAPGKLPEHARRPCERLLTGASSPALASIG